MSIEKKNNDIVFVTGVSASGKDFLLERAKTNFSNDTLTFSLGALIHADMRRKFPDLYERSDSLKMASLEDLRMSADYAMRKLSEESEEKTIVLNGHVTYRRQESVVVDPNMNIALNPRDYIFVESDPDEILSRRITDKRDRVIEPIDSIYVHQEIARVAVAAIAKKIGAKVYNIVNNESNIDNNVDLISEIVNRK